MKRILDKMIEKREWDELYDYLEASAASLFSTPYLNDLYAVIREVDLSLSKRTLPRLIVAWMAFLCGDHARAFPIVRGIAPEMLESPEAESMYEGLLALSGHTNNPEVGLAHAARSVQVLKDREPSLYLGNAYLTYGQLLAASKQYRHAAEVFHRSYDVFYPRGDGFAAAVAITNETLNRYRLGQFHEVIDLCHRNWRKPATFKAGRIHIGRFFICPWACVITSRLVFIWLWSIWKRQKPLLTLLGSCICMELEKSCCIGVMPY